MTATAITYLAAREHINDLRREADHGRLVADARPARRIRTSVLRMFARGLPRTATA
jgi:hypothetical protein